MLSGLANSQLATMVLFLGRKQHAASTKQAGYALIY